MEKLSLFIETMIFAAMVVFLFSSCEKRNTTQSFEPVSYKFISGITNLSILSSDILQKKIYLFGEKHTKTGRCPEQVISINVEDLIYSLPGNSDQFIDIFLEAEPPLSFKGGEHVEKSSSSGGGLSVLRDRLKSCYEPPHDCLYSNMRVHWTDLRTSAMEKFFKGFTAQFKLEDLLKTFTLGARIKLDPVWKNVLSPAAAFKFLKNEVIPHSKIGKQWESLPPQYFQIFLNLAENKIKKDRKLFEAINLIVKVGNDGTVFTYQKYAEDYLKVVITAMGIFLSPVTDAYALGRFLRDFKQGPGSDKPQQIKNAVFLFGSAHIELMEEFLLQIGFKLEQNFIIPLENNNKIYDQCINIKGLQKPYF